jgi:hypothetical protein
VDVDALLELERKVWQALVAGDPAADAAMLAEDFLGVYPTGFADRDEHVGQLHDGPTVAAFELHHPRVVAISDDAALLVYRADYRRPDAAGDQLESMYVSSLWCRRGDRWMNVFSQDTPPGPSVV